MVIVSQGIFPSAPAGAGPAGCVLTAAARTFVWRRANSIPTLLTSKTSVLTQSSAGSFTGIQSCTN